MNRTSGELFCRRAETPRIGWRLLLLLLALTAAPAAAQHSLYFGGSGVVEAQRVDMPSPQDPLTIELRYKLRTAVKKPVHLVSRWNPDDKAEDRGSFHVGFASGSKLVFGLRDDSGALLTVTGKAPRSDGLWHHVAAVFDGESAKLFLDGQELGSEIAADFGPRARTELPLVIGPVAAEKSRTPAVLDGFLGGVSVWSEARSQDATVADLGGPLPRNHHHLRAHFDLREPNPAPVVRDRARGQEGRLSEQLARTGWAVTSGWDGAEQASVDLHCYDLTDSQGTSELEGSWRRILVSHDKAERVGVLWQHERSRSIAITWVDAEAGQHQTVQLPSELHRADRKKKDDSPGITNGFLAAGTSDPDGNLYYLVFEDGPRDREESVPLLGTLFKSSASGELLAEQAIDCSRDAFNVWSFNRGHANMRFSKGQLGLILPRTMYRSGDGLRHQGAIAVVFSAKSLEVVRRLGTTSSHSKGNILSVNSRGEFLGLDLGDNYPRGVHLHKFTASNKESAVVFTFKTAHGTRPRNDSPVYDEISGNGQTFYKWSNDNATYSELGGVIDGRKHLSVIFSTDQSSEGKVLDNSRAFRGSGDPRNLAMLRVVKSFGRAGGGSVVRDAIMAGLPKPNQVEEAGFYTFAGGWSKQRVTGVIWLTHYESNESAHSPQVTLLDDNNVLILWQKSGPQGDSLQVMKVAQSGKVVAGPMQLDLELRLNPRDRLLRIEDRIYLLAASGGRDGRSALYSIWDD